MRLSRLYLHRYLLPALTTYLFLSIAQGQVGSPIPLDVSGLSTSPIMRWTHVADAVTHHFQVSYDPSFSALVADDSTITDTMNVVDPLPPDTGYYWRVSSKSISGTSDWSRVNRFYAVSGESVYTYKMPIDGWNLISLPIRM